MILPSVVMTGLIPKSCCAPPNASRNPVITSSKISTLPYVGSMFTLFFNPDPVTNNTVAGRSDTKLFARYFWGMIGQGVYLPCSQFEANFVSVAHTAADIETTIAVAREVLSSLRP